MNAARLGASCALLVLLFACASTSEPELAAKDLVASLAGDAPERRTEAAVEAWRAGPAAMASVGALLADENPSVRSNAELALSTIAHHAAAPGDDRERRKASAELVALLETDLPAEARRAVLRLLGATATDGDSVRAVTARLDDAELAEAALFALQRIPRPDAGRALAEALSREGLALSRSDLARALGARRDGEGGDELLELAAAGQPEEARVARQALARSGDPRAGALLVTAFERREPGAVEDLLDYADARLDAGATKRASELYEMLWDAPAGFQRAAAVRGIARAGGDGELERLIAPLDDPAPEVRAAAREGLVAARARTAARRIQQALDPPASPARRAQLLRVLAARGDPETTRLVREALEDSHAELRLAALELSGELDSPALEAALLRCAQGGSPIERATARGSLARCARGHRARGEDQQALELYHALLAEPEPTALAIEALAGVAALASPSSLEWLRPLESRPELVDGVDRARAAIATRLATSDHAAAVLELESVATGVAERSVRQEAARELAALGVDTGGFARRRGFLDQWHLCGPFPAPSAEDFGSHPFGEAAGDAGQQLPEVGSTDAGATSQTWKLERSDDIDGAIDLATLFDPHDNVCAYACADIEWPEEGEVLLRLGSDDGIAVWLNGEPVHENDVQRGLGVDQDEVRVRLLAGGNRILLKITQGGGGWEFCARLCRLDGGPIDLAAAR